MKNILSLQVMEVPIFKMATPSCFRVKTKRFAPLAYPGGNGHQQKHVPILVDTGRCWPAHWRKR